MREKYYEDQKENAAFERHVDVVTQLILKYGPALKRKWEMESLFKNIWMDFRWDWSYSKILGAYYNISLRILKGNMTT